VSGSPTTAGTAPTSYDHVFYPGHAFDQTHPGHLATLGVLFGMDPTPIERCRVLELGCGLGGNLLPMAYHLPGSQFVGIDLSAQTIVQGQANIDALGLTNLRLVHGDILEIGPDWGQFDYIIAHGVYSWVPPHVREKMLTVFKENLTPNGLVYVSYNSYPGSHLRNIARDLMLYHVRDMSEPQERIGQARALLAFMAENSMANDVYGTVLRDQLVRVRAVRDEVLFHDDLDEVSTPFYLQQVADDAARHGLQYVCDASFSRSSFESRPEPIKQAFSGIPVENAVAREQYLDFIEGHGFRRSVLCHDAAALSRPIDPERIRRLFIAAATEPADPLLDPSTDGIGAFRTERGETLSTDHKLSKAALVCLGRAWPSAIAFHDLVEQSLASLGHVQDSLRTRLEEEMSALAIVLFRTFAAGHLELHRHAPQLVTTITERPLANGLARKQAQSGSLLTNARHGTVLLEDTIARQFLALVDGSRTVEMLVADLRGVLISEGSCTVEAAAAMATPDLVERNLRFLSKLGLLVA